MTNAIAIRTGLIAALLATAANFAMSESLGMTPGTPLATRCDVLFQSDSGQRIRDAGSGESSFGAGSHFLMAKLWPKSMKFISDRFADPAAAAVYVCRLTVALLAGLGLGVFAGCLVRIGVPWQNLLVMSPVYFLGTAQVMASLPDHFAISSGLLPATFGAFLLSWHRVISFRLSLTLLIPAVALAGGICITNALWPLVFLAVIVWRRLGWRFRNLALLSLIPLTALIAFLAIVPKLKDDTALVWQVKLWLNLRLVEAPEEAAKRMLRGTVNPAVGPEPAIDTNNFFEVPMLTYEPRGKPFEWWPYRGWAALAATAWLGLLIASASALRAMPGLLLALGVAANLIFHNLWGDEFFLYSPHSSWAVFGLILLSTRTWPAWPLSVLCLLMLPGQLASLAGIRALLATLPA